MGDRLERRLPHAPATTSAPDTVVALAAIDNLGKGAAGQMIQCANLMLGLDEGAGPVQYGSLSMSVTAAEGFVAAGPCTPGSRPAAAATSALLATDDGKPVPTAAVFTQNKFRAPPVEASLERLNVSGGYGGGRDRQFAAMPMPAPAPRAAPMPRRCATRRPKRSAATRATCWSARPA